MANEQGTQGLKNAVAVSPLKTASDFMEKLKPQLALALPKHLSADRMTRLALTAFSTNKALQDCTMQSIAASVMTAAQLGLEPGVNGAGYLIPYKTTCTFVPGWRGLVDLVSRSGRATIFTGVIYKDQDYTYTDGARRDLVIHNSSDLDDVNDITHAYAIGWVKDAAMPIIELWTIAKIKKHLAKYNKVGTNHYAIKNNYQNFEMYARKIPLLQVLKYLPCSIEVSNATAIANAADSGHGAIIENGIVIEMGADEPEQKKESGSQALKNAVADKSKAENKHPEKIDLSTGEITKTMSFAIVADLMNSETNVDDLDAHATLIDSVPDAAHQVELHKLYVAKRDTLVGNE